MIYSTNNRRLFYSNTTSRSDTSEVNMVEQIDHSKQVCFSEEYLKQYYQNAKNQTLYSLCYAIAKAAIPRHQDQAVISFDDGVDDDLDSGNGLTHELVAASDDNASSKKNDIQAADSAAAIIDPQDTPISFNGKPKSILRKQHQPENSRWPITSQTSKRFVHFPTQPITCIRIQPRTHIFDVPELHYSYSEIKQFKRDYKLAVQQRSDKSRNTIGFIQKRR